MFEDIERFVLILDTEGLLSIEKNNDEFDRQITLFSMACSHIFVINVNGEINNSMKKILSVSLYAAMKTQTVGHKPIIYFVLRNMVDLNIGKQREMIKGIENALNEVSRLSRINFQDVLDYRGDNSFILTVSAFNKIFMEHFEEKIFEKNETKSEFCKTMDSFRFEIASNHVNKTNIPMNNLILWTSHASAVWRTIMHFNDFFHYESIKEMEDRDDLIRIQNEIISKYIDKNIKELENKYTEEVTSCLNLKTVGISKSNYERKLDNDIDNIKNNVNQQFETDKIISSKPINLKKEYLNILNLHINSGRDEIN